MYFFFWGVCRPTSTHFEFSVSLHIILLLLLRSGCTQRARARSFPSQNFQKICHNFGTLTKTFLSLCEYKLSLYFLSPLRGGRKFTTFLGNSVASLKKSDRFFFRKFSLLPSQCRSGARFPLGPSRPPTSYCPCLPNFCAIVSLLFLTHTSARLPACCTALASLACSRCFGELLSDAACGSSFGEQLWGATAGSNFAALQEH